MISHYSLHKNEKFNQTLFFKHLKKKKLSLQAEVRFPKKDELRAPRIELGTYCVLSNRHNQLDQARFNQIFKIVIKTYFYINQYK